MLSLMLSVLVGGGLGAALGHFGKCASGSCPLTSTWWRGAIYGAVLGGVFYSVSGNRGSASLNESTPNVKRINESQFEAEVTQAVSPVVVDVYAPWCGPCKTLSPMLDKLAEARTNKVTFVKLNLDEAPELARRFEIQAVPTLLFFKNGKLVDRIVGLPSTDVLTARLDSLAP